MVSLCGMLTRTVSVNKVTMNIVRRTVAAMRNPRDAPETGNFASGPSNVAISFAPPGNYDPAAMALFLIGGTR